MVERYRPRQSFSDLEAAAVFLEYDLRDSANARRCRILSDDDDPRARRLEELVAANKHLSNAEIDDLRAQQEGRREVVRRRTAAEQDRELFAAFNRRLRATVNRTPLYRPTPPSK